MSGVTEIRSDLIKKYRRQINEKSYVVKSKEIAQKMASELFNKKSSNGRVDFRI